MTNAHSGTLHIDEATLSYDIREGTSSTIVMLHGVGSSRASEEAAGYLDWSPVYALGRRTVRYDARGHGRSTGGTQPDDYTWSHLADDLLTLLDNVAPGEVVDGIGVSMGVGTLLQASTREPKRFRRLALVLPPTAWEARTAQADAYRPMADLVDTHGADALRARIAAAPTLPLIAAGGWTFPLQMLRARSSPPYCEVPPSPTFPIQTQSLASGSRPSCSPGRATRDIPYPHQNNYTDFYRIPHSRSTAPSKTSKRSVTRSPGS
jgi:pimeloyl-ACP methyl ester carboxylesterase